MSDPFRKASPPIAGESSKVPQRHSLSLKRAAFTLIAKQEAMLIIRHSKEKEGLKVGQVKLGHQ